MKFHVEYIFAFFLIIDVDKKIANSIELAIDISKFLFV